jgi:endonuclease G
MENDPFDTDYLLKRIETRIEILKTVVKEFGILDLNGIGPLVVNGAINWKPTLEYEHRIDRAIHSVGRVRWMRGEIETLGTGFLVGPDLFLTNHHVLPDQDAVDNAVIWIDYDEESDIPNRGFLEACCVEFIKSSPPGKLDYTLVRIKFPGMKITSFEPLYVDLRNLGEWPEENKDSVIIIQHPNGGPRVMTMQDSLVTEVLGRIFRYQGDTLPGSSGSPVFDFNFKIIGLHHSHQGRRNEAIDIREIVREIKDFIP